MPRMHELTHKDHRLLDETESVVGPRMRNSSMLFFDASVPDRPVLGSGTFVLSGGKKWIATAAHVVDVVHRRRGATIAWQAPNAIPYSQVPFESIVRRFACGRSGDVAALLLKDDAPVASESFVPAHQLAQVTAPAMTADFVWLVGSPQAALDLVRQHVPGRDLQVISRLTTSLRESCAVNPLHADDDMEAYPRDPRSDFHADWSEFHQFGAEYRPMFRANGLSGGAMWTAQAPPGAVWSADLLRLTGICVHQNRAVQCVRAVPFGVWFEAAEGVLAAHD